MATDFWASSHYKRWIVDRATLRQARIEDLQYVDDPEHLDFLAIFFANVITKLAKKLQLRQRVIATATVFFRRFYLKNFYCETDPFIVVAACCYVAAKAEESPVHIKNVVSEARLLFSYETYSIKNFPSDNSKLAEMEFYLVDDLECDLTVFHPYRTLMALCKKEGSSSRQGVVGDSTAEAGEVGVGIVDGPRYWGTGEGQLELQEGALQLAWFIINDTYRSDLCLIYPPHLIAIAAIYLALVLDVPTLSSIGSHAHTHIPGAVQPPPRRSSRNSSSSTKKPPPDPITFLSELNVSLPLVATIAQEILALYALWDRYKEDAPPESAVVRPQSRTQSSSTQGSAQGSPISGGSTSLKRPASAMSRSGSRSTHANTNSNAGTPAPEIIDLDTDAPGDVTVREQQGKAVVTPTFLMRLLLRMRESRLTDLAHPASARPIAVNKMLERTQAAG